MKKDIYFCYSSKVYQFLRERQHYFIFTGFTLDGSRVTLFEVSDRLSRDLREYSKQRETVNENEQEH